MVTFSLRKNIAKLLLICLIIATHFKANACDVCGCSIGGTNFGILPQFHKHFIGVQYGYSSFNSEHLILGTETKSISQEIFQTVELRGRFHLSKKFQTFVFLPFNINQQNENNSKTKLSGIGDLSVLVNYNIFNNGDSIHKKWKHNFQMGGGLKLPTGHYNSLDNSNSLNPNIQTGTGSYDFLINSIYTVRYKKIGLNNAAIYRFNNSNRNKFTFGDRFTFATSLFYWANIEGYSLLPSIGINYENARKDKHNASILSQSGGNTLFSTLGLDFYYQEFAIGAHMQLPTFQDNSVASSKIRINATLLYNF